MPNPFSLLRCVVVEDEPLAAEMLTDYISQTPYLELLSVARFAAEANQALWEQKPDLLFLDLHIPGARGFSLLEQLPRPHPLIIVTTAHAEYAPAGYDYQISSFLTKPVEWVKFELAIQKIRQQQQQTLVPVPEEKFFLRCEREIIAFTESSILYLEAMQNYVKIHTADRFYLYRSPLYQTLQVLPKNKFIQLSRQIIVQKALIERINKNKAYLHIDKEFLIEFPFRQKVHEALTKYS